jgi:protein O-GlcNAc transferase
VCFRADPIEPPRRAASGPPVFGSFNSAAKITPTTIDLWASVLREIPDSRLLLKARGLDDPFVTSPIIDSFSARGISSDRIELRGRIEDPRGHLSLYGEIDVALDTFPYHGTTTTCEALSMGVPVVSLEGDAHRSRVGASLLATADPNPSTSLERFATQAIAALEAERAASERRSRLGDRILEAGAFARAFGSLLESA